ncbi:hypothetical protein BCR36DRAFT_345565 [Piromyces finnis]|uniref:CST complex subunit STN1 n=1 Tax=Piromyces finnis TaxID=1754191 RepID=A0A1Y1VHN6_9FUNG|nr:hypothetical protein BCR36DRAFT_345565 [Piromyces finnis]|eukprot:ORX56474.1 hypothetical protein BCR36DRAFT_345565 [Piromyces finnis]
MAEKPNTNNNILYWGLNPKFWATPSVFIKDIYLMESYNSITEYYNYYNNPVLKVKILGVITAKDINSKIISYTVDDGSERIECIMFKKDLNENEISDKSQFQLFDTISIKGKIYDFKKQRKLNIISIKKEYDRNVEAFFWLEVIKQRKEYQKEYNITEESKKDVKEFYSNKRLNAKQKSFYNYNEIFKKLDNSKRQKIGNNSIIKDENILKCNVMKYLSDNKLYSFQFSKIMKENELRNKAIELLEEKENNSASENQISLLFQKVFYQLVKEGVIFQLDSYHDTYALIHYKYNLGEAIFGILKNKNECVSYQDILKLLSNTTAFKYAPEKVVKKALNYLVTNQKLSKNTNKDGETLYKFIKQSD